MSTPSEPRKVKARVRIRQGVGEGSVMVGFVSPDGEIPAFVAQDDVELQEGSYDDGFGDVVVTVLAEAGDTYVVQIPGESPMKGAKFAIARSTTRTA